MSAAPDPPRPAAWPGPARGPRAVPGRLLRLPGSSRVERLDNGLTVCLLRNRQAPLVATALWYRVGARDEAPGQAGVAHFLEHMMFKGSPLYAAGEIDRRTQALGGANNAYTTYDATAYYFSFAGDRWTEALRVEADRMERLTLDPIEIDSERQVILEELSMYEDDPWESLEIEVQSLFFGGHPYGRPILGRREDLRAIGRAELESFHRRFYRPDRAVLVLAGDLDESALDRVREGLGALAPAGTGRQPLAGARRPQGVERLTRRKGEVPRLVLALPAPAAAEPDYAPLRLLLTALGGGRASRLHHRLVDVEELCVSVAAEVTESEGPGMTAVAAELLPGVEPARVEEAVLDELDRLRREPPAPAELERARRIVVADWVFGVERISQQAMAAGLALAVFDWSYPERHLRQIVDSPRETLGEVGERWLRAEESSVVGWSLPEDGGPLAADA